MIKGIQIKNRLFSGYFLFMISSSLLSRVSAEGGLQQGRRTRRSGAQSY